MSEDTTLRSDIPGIDPDDVYKSAKLANGYRSRLIPAYQVGPTSIVSSDEPDAVMNVTASTHDSGFNALCHLGHMSDACTIYEIPTEPAASGSRA